MLQQQLLGGSRQVKQLTISGKRFATILRGCAAVAGVVVHGRGADLVQLDSVRARPIVICVGQQKGLAFGFKKFVSLGCKFSGKFNRHIYNLV